MLPHKELRFIIYTLPLLNTVAAVSFVGLWNRVCSPLQKFLTRMCLVGIVVATIFTTVNLTMISRLNYPGGEASPPSPADPHALPPCHTHAHTSSS